MVFYYYENYYQPASIIKALYNNGIKNAWISSTTSCIEWSNDKEKDITAYRMVSDYVKSNNKKNFIFVTHCHHLPFQVQNGRLHRPSYYFQQI